ncbi:MAG: hypothetical protein FH748_04270 [Balneolaceae bacterium]|nr:hypothetical protein [Balneolaceae bacterium]
MYIIGQIKNAVGFDFATVVVENHKKNSIVTTFKVESDGCFDVDDLPDNTVLKFYVLPQQKITDINPSEDIKNDDLLLYMGIYDPVKDPLKGIYLNGASTLITALMEEDTSLGYEEASDTIRNYLFGNVYQQFAPGYCTEFIAQVSPPSLFSPHKFLGVACSEGRMAYVRKLVTNQDQLKTTTNAYIDEYADSIKSPVPENENTNSSSAPTIPSSANWAMNHSSWASIIKLQTAKLAGRMKNIEHITDGIAAMANGIPGNGNTEGSAGSTLGDFGKWAKTQLAGNVAAYVCSYGFSLLKSWIFNKQSPQKEIQKALSQISGQLSTVISNQVVEIKALHRIIHLLHKNEVQKIVLNMTNSVSVIQSNYQVVYNHTQTKSGLSGKHLHSIAKTILNADVGVPEALLNIYNNIDGTANKGLPSPLLKYLTDEQDLLGNQNFYAAVQKIFAYYALLQTQGVMLCVQAHNYDKNKSVSAPSTKLQTSSSAKALYNEWLIGGAGAGENGKPYLTMEIQLFQSTFSDYYTPFQGNVSSGNLPDDLAIGLVPQIADQPTPVFYNKVANLLIFGYVSEWVKNWTSGHDIIKHNKQYFPGGKFFPLPGNLEWRYPSLNEWDLITKNGADTHTNIFNYLKDQGVNFGGIDISALDGLWSCDSASVPVAWDFDTKLPFKQNPVPPKTANYADASVRFWHHNKCPFGPGLWHVQIPLNAESFAQAYAPNRTSFLNSSMNLDTYTPGTRTPSWQNSGFGKIYGMVVSKCS